MKLVLLGAFLLLSLVLPLVLALQNKKRGMVVSMVMGLIIYVLATIFNNFFAMCVGLSDITTSEERRIYVVFTAVALTLAVVIMGFFKNVYGDKKQSDLIYAGFALANTFINNMNSYSFLLFIGLNNSIDSLTEYYPSDVASELFDYYGSITVSDLVLLILEMALTFFILRALFNFVCRKEKQIFNYVFFLVGVFLLYYIQYMIDNVLLGFMAYGLFLIVTYHRLIPVRRKKRHEE